MRFLALTVAFLSTSPLAKAAPTAAFPDVEPNQQHSVSASTQAGAPKPHQHGLGNARPPTPSSPAKRKAQPLKESWATRAARTLAERGQRARLQGDLGNAARHFHEAVRMDPTYAPGYLGLGQVREDLGDYGQALRTYERATRLRSGGDDAFERLARLSRRLGKKQQSLAALEAAVQLNPSEQTRLELLARWYVEHKAWPAALSLWRRIVDRLRNQNAGESEVQRAELQVAALSLLAGDSDPTAATDPNWIRRSLSHIAKRNALR